MQQKTILIAVSSLALGVTFDILFYGKVPGISVLLYVLAVLAGSFYLAQRTQFKINRSVYLLVPAMVFFSLMIFVRASPLLAFINILTILYLLALGLKLFLNPALSLPAYNFRNYLERIPGWPLRGLRVVAHQLQHFVKQPPQWRDKSIFGPYARGVLISLPVLLLFVLLLSSADAVFKTFIDSIFSFKINFSLDPNLVAHTILILFITGLFTSAYALVLLATASVPKTPKAPTFKFGMPEAYILLGSVSLLFLIFIGIQVTYLFGGSSQIAATGYTYAEYARKGFFELIVVAVVSMLLILAVKKLVTVREQSNQLSFKLLCSGLIVEVMVIVASAHTRLSLYESAYGFTILRLISHFFILWLVLAFILLLIHIIRNQPENQLAFRLFVSAIVFCAIFNLLNPDALIARQNISRYRSTGKLDTPYLNSLSEDAVPIVVKALEQRQEIPPEQTAMLRGYLTDQKSKNQSQPWQSANLARHRASAL